MNMLKGADVIHATWHPREPCCLLELDSLQRNSGLRGSEIFDGRSLECELDEETDTENFGCGKNDRVCRDVDLRNSILVLRAR